MLAAYYGSGNDSRELFAGREIGSDSSYEEHLNRYDVRQSRDRQYTRALEGDSDEVPLVGVNYDKDGKNKHHDCVIEKMAYESRLAP